MKKLSITKEAFEKSKYFTSKYGKLEYVSESGKLFKTEKGNILKFKEAIMGGGEYEPSYDDDEDEDEKPLAEWKVGEIVDIDSWQVMWEYDDEERLPEKGWKIVNVERDENYDDCDGYCYTIVNIRNPKLKVEVSASALVERKSVKKSGGKLKKSTKKFGRKFKESRAKPMAQATLNESVGEKWAVFVDDGIDEIFDSRDEAKRYASSVRDDSDSYNRRTRAYVKKLSRSEIEEMFGESVGDVSKDPAYQCPYCGSRDCEFDDAEEIGTGLTEGYFDGATFNAQYWCNKCGKPYNVEFELKVKDVYPNEDADMFDDDDL